MKSPRVEVPAGGPRLENGWREAIQASCALLRREGFNVSWARGVRGNGKLAGHELLAENGGRIVRVLVLLDREMDSASAQKRIRAAYRAGETRVFVPWPLRWRMLSNIARWGLQGVSVGGV